MTAKKTKIDISGVTRVDPLPLRQRLKTFRGLKADIAAAHQRHAALKNEIDDFMEGADPDDMEKIQLVSAKRTQLEILPRMVARAERQLENDLAPALRLEADKFRSGLIRFYNDAHAAVASAVAGIIGRYYSGQVAKAPGEVVERAQQIAIQCDDCREIALRREEANRVHLDDQPRSNFPDLYDGNLCAAADTLLALAERE